VPAHDRPRPVCSRHAFSLDAAGAWLGPAAVAAQHKVPLYSDDVFLRAAARSRGVPAFGTVALFKALVESGQIDPDGFKAVIGRLFRSRVVDLPTVWPLVIQAAQADASSSLSVLVNVGRPWFWDDVGEENLVEVIVAVAQHTGDRAEAIDTVTTAMAEGLAAAIAPTEQILGILGALVIAHSTNLSPEAAEPVLRAIQRAATRCSVDATSALRQRLIAILTDQAAVFGLSIDEAQQTAD
jgi:predicted nucleic acid-binding protein